MVQEIHSIINECKDVDSGHFMTNSVVLHDHWKDNDLRTVNVDTLSNEALIIVLEYLQYLEQAYVQWALTPNQWIKERKDEIEHLLKTRS